MLIRSAPSPRAGLLHAPSTSRALSMAWTVDSGDVGLQEQAVACSHVRWQWLREQFRSNSYHLLSIFYYIIKGVLKEATTFAERVYKFSR